MPEEKKIAYLKSEYPKTYIRTYPIIALHAVFIKVKQKQKVKNVVCALSQTEG